MVQFDAKIVNVRVYSNGDSIRYRVTFDQTFDAIVKDANGDFVDGKVDYIDFTPRVLIAQALSCVDGLDYLYSKKKEKALRGDSDGGFGAAELQVVLKGSLCSIERDKVLANSEYTDADGVVHTREHDGYTTSIVAIKVTERIQAKLDALLDSALGL